MEISGTHLRGIYPSKVNFEFPITAIVGENGSGKSTLLGLISCAFHNESDFCPQSLSLISTRTTRHYYTYSDFFAFTSVESGLISEINITSTYQNKDTEGNNIVESDIRKKKPSGKWTDYNKRPKRSVSFLGINRILPPSESSAYKHNRRNFSGSLLTDSQKAQLISYMTDIFGRVYSGIDLSSHKNYKLFSVERGVPYSGFNMGAGENAVLQLLYEIMTAGEGALIVIDEIELGLHAKAQKRLIDLLKKLAKQYKNQIICSTHSKIVLASLPPEGRIYIRSGQSSTTYIPQISPTFAFSLMAETNESEINVIVEDTVAEKFLKAVLSSDISRRINITIAGSADKPVLSVMGADHIEGRNHIVLLDGDKRGSRANHIATMVRIYPDRENIFTDEYYASHLCYLPGDVWPEKHMIQSVLSSDSISFLSEMWRISDDIVRSILSDAIAAGKHNEFRYINNSLGEIGEKQVITDMARAYDKANHAEILALEQAINNLLG